MNIEPVPDVPPPKPRRVSWASWILFLLILGILCALGFWQCARLGWKNQLQMGISVQLSMIKSCELAPRNRPDSPDCFPSLSPKILDYLGKNDIKFGRLKLQVMARRALLLNGFVQNGKSYFTVIAPAQIVNEAEENGVQSSNSDPPMITVILGLTQDPNIVQKLADHPEIFMTGPDGQKMLIDIGEPQSFYGVARLAPLSYFSFVLPANNLEKSEWWRFDLADFGNYWRTKSLSPAVFYLIPNGDEHMISGGDITQLPVPQDHGFDGSNEKTVNEKTADKKITNENTMAPDLSPPPVLLAYPFNPVLRNDHLSYAIFWFVMAGIWAMMFAIYRKTKS